MEKTPVTVWIYAYQAGQFELLKKRYRAEQAATLTELVRQGKKKKDARILVASMRATEWPSLDAVVSAAVEQRLAESDLAGPWRPLSSAESDELALAGRWPGPSMGVTLVQRHYCMPSGLVSGLRTAAWRKSEGPLRELRSRGLVGSGLVLDDAQRATRDEIAARLYPVPRIVREALARYGSRPSE